MLEPSELPAAVTLLQELTSGAPGLETRLELAELYREAGFWGAADFFEETVEVARGGELDPSPMESPIAWSAKTHVVSDRPAKVADRIGRSLQEGDVDLALAESELLLESEEPSLQVVVQWADAVLWKSAVEPEDVSPEALETAVRIYLTSLTEKMPLPRGVVSRAAGYARLSSVFGAAGDPLSALTASLIGLLHVQAGSEVEDLGPAVRQMLCGEAESLSRRLGFAPEGSPEGRAYSVCRTVKR